MPLGVLFQLQIQTVQSAAAPPQRAYLSGIAPYKFGILPTHQICEPISKKYLPARRHSVPPHTYPSQATEGGLLLFLGSGLSSTIFPAIHEHVVM
jgi:hypothetical protein